MRRSNFLFLTMFTLFLLMSSNSLAEDPDLNVNGSISINGQKVVDSAGNWVGSPTGLQGPQGEPGLPGPQGIQGETGPQGPPGQMSCNWTGWKYSVAPDSGCLFGCAFGGQTLKMYCLGGVVTEVSYGSVCFKCADINP